MELSDFQWAVVCGEYTFVDAWTPSFNTQGPPPASDPDASPLFRVGGTNRFLTTGKPEWLSRWRTYRLQDKDPALFRRFAYLDPTEESIVRFASQYGPLGISHAIWIEGDNSTGPPEGWSHDGGLPEGEWFGDWVQAIRAMNRAVRLWDAVVGGDLATMAELSTASTRPTLDVVSGVRHGMALLAEAVPEDAAPGVKLRALSTIQNLCRGFLSVRPSLRYDEEQDRLRLVLSPEHLLSAMWLQFADAVDAQTQFRRCAFTECQQWFPVEPSSGRSDKRFCSNTCRAKASYRQRKGSAK